MAKEPQYYGFSLPTATKLQGIARRDGLHARHKLGIKYPPIGVQANGGYFAKVPVSGIPARSGSTPGEATCDIYKIEKNTGGDWEIQDAGFSVGVFNVFPVSVAFDASSPYFNVHQDQFGRWINEAPQVAQSPGIPFYNNSGEVMPPGALIRVGDGALTLDTVYLEGLKPNNDFYSFYLINGPTPVAILGTSNGSFLTDLVGGVYISDGTTPNTNLSYGPTPGSWGVTRDRPGFAPLSDDVTTISGFRQGYMKQREINEVYGKYYDVLTPGGSALFEIWIRENNDIKPAGWNKIEVFDYWLEVGNQVEVGTKGTARFYSQVWEAGITACTPDNSTGSSANTPAFRTLELANSQALQIANTRASQPNPGLNLARGLPPTF